MLLEFSDLINTVLGELREYSQPFLPSFYLFDNLVVPEKAGKVMFILIPMLKNLTVCKLQTKNTTGLPLAYIIPNKRSTHP